MTFENIVATGEINYIQCSLFFSSLFEAVDNENVAFKSVLAESHPLAEQGLSYTKTQK